MVKKAKSRAPRAGRNKESKYICGVCGMAISVDGTTDRIDTGELVCCGKQMMNKRRVSWVKRPGK